MSRRNRYLSAGILAVAVSLALGELGAPLWAFVMVGVLIGLTWP